jgi:cytochrome c
MSPRSWPALAALALLTAGATPAAAMDPANGEKIFKKCKACHTTEPGKNKIGPSLAGVIGRTAGGLEGYKYSKAMKAYGAAGTIWGEDTLEVYLADPRGVVKGTKMTFPGLKKETERADVIAFLMQLPQ